MTKEQKEEVKKAHLLLTFFNAMQPGIFMISGWDLVGSYPLKTTQVEGLIKDNDNRWINRGAYDLLGINPAAEKSEAGIPKAETLYGSLPDQLKDPSSYVSILKKMLKIRKEYQINIAKHLYTLNTKNPALYIAVYKLYNNSILMIAINFSTKVINEKIEIPEINRTRAKDIILGKKEDKKYFSDIYNIQLNALETKAIIFE